MAVIVITLDPPSGEQAKAYFHWAMDKLENETSKLPGVTGVRAYQDPAKSTPQVMLLYEFDSLQSAWNYVHSDTWGRVTAEAREQGATNLGYRVWDGFPGMP